MPIGRLMPLLIFLVLSGVAVAELLCWGRGSRQGHGDYVVPVGYLMGSALILLFSGLAVARLL